MKSKSTRDNALKKMNQFKVKIGYPDEWIDYSTLDIQAGQSFLSMIFQSCHFDLKREIKEMNAPTDKKKWFMTPQTINAYYHPSLNEIVFPAAILQAPMFDPAADFAVNFGAIGAVVGHEMTHGFDDKGRKFNFEGNMVDWWTLEDAKEYEQRVQVMVDQADAYEVHGQSLKGKLTCGKKRLYESCFNVTLSPSHLFLCMLQKERTLPIWVVFDWHCAPCKLIKTMIQNPKLEGLLLSRDFFWGGPIVGGKTLPKSVLCNY